MFYLFGNKFIHFRRCCLMLHALNHVVWPVFFPLAVTKSFSFFPIYAKQRSCFTLLSALLTAWPSSGIQFSTYTLFPLKSKSCCRLAPCRHSCMPPVTMRNSLGEAQASSMHVALDCLPPPGLAAPRHHAANAVTAAGPFPSPRASTTPAVTGPGQGPSAALPTLIRSPTDRHSEADRQQRNTDAQKKEERERERKTRWTEDETDV